MPYDVDIGDGADALGRNQLSDALDGTYWVSGWDATLGTGDLEVDIAAGEGAINGGDVSTGSTQTVDFTGDVDGTDPRKAVISVDDTGTVQKTLGTAVPAAPTDEVRFRTYDPQPPTNAPGVVVAEVWLAAGATGLVSADVRDRRVGNDAVEGITFDASLTASGYTDKSANRSFGTEYTNTSGSPIELRISTSINSDSDQYQVRLDVGGNIGVSGIQLEDASTTQNIGSTTLIYTSAIVPDGATYELVDRIGNASIANWYEQTLSVQ